MFELGLRLAFDKPAIIVKDDNTSYSFDTAPIECVFRLILTTDSNRSWTSFPGFPECWSRCRNRWSTCAGTLVKIPGMVVNIPGIGQIDGEARGTTAGNMTFRRFLGSGGSEPRVC